MSFTTTLTSQGQVTIPIAIRQMLNLKPSSKVNFSIEGNKVYLQPSDNFLDLRGSIKTNKILNDDEADELIVDGINEDYEE